MKEKLFFYSRTAFPLIKSMREAEGIEIVSATKFIKDRDLIESYDFENKIIDISVFSAMTNIEFHAEELLDLFDDDVVFYSDSKNKESFSIDLRYCFRDFEDLETPNDNVTVENASSKTHLKITDLDEEQLLEFFDKFRSKLYGHEKFKDDFQELIKTFRIFNRIREHRVLSLFLLGESGVGKTEVARTIYECLGGKRRIAKVNFGNYSSEFSLSSLIGSARGYTGSEDGEIFIRVRDTDIGIVLIDEFEKSNATLFNYFLDVLESGKIVSSMAEEIDLNGFIIIFTSNISKEDFSQRISPELRSRFDYKGQFTLLYNEDKEKYVEFRIKSIVAKVKKEYQIDLPENLHQKFLEKIDVSKFTNMRDLNKKIKRTFVEYVSNENEITDSLDPTSEKISFGKKILKLISKKDS